MEIQDSRSVLALDFLDLLVESKVFEEAFNFPYLKHRIKYREAISKELK
jgi:hypothetical protein